jgi:trehalose-6-phosphatase
MSLDLRFRGSEFSRKDFALSAHYRCAKSTHHAQAQEQSSPEQKLQTRPLRCYSYRIVLVG